jgi:DNA-binding GntR family transcriptional regulator
VIAEKQNHPSLVDTVIESVFEAVASGRLAPGSKITEERLAAQFGVSRTPVREAVKRMAEMGLVRVRPRCGLEVAAIDESDLAEITQLREELESFALRLAATRITPEEISELEELQRDCERRLEEQDRIAIFRADGRFHLAVARFSGNRYLLDSLRRLEMKVQLCRALFCRSDAKVRSSVRFHRRIISALKKGQAGRAADLMREHVNRTVKEK